ncbi:MAG TPA: hypothetical protein VF441_00480, partial [Acidimicrobiia bacterium]
MDEASFVAGTGAGVATLEGGVAWVDGVIEPCAPGGTKGSPPPDGVFGCCGVAGAGGVSGAAGAGAAVAGGGSLQPSRVTGSHAWATPVVDHA